MTKLEGQYVGAKVLKGVDIPRTLIYNEASFISTILPITPLPIVADSPLYAYIFLPVYEKEFTQHLKALELNSSKIRLCWPGRVWVRGERKSEARMSAHPCVHRACEFQG